MKIGELLGMKQEDIAMLLRVTRSQWSMFELRKRDLPIGAKLKLAEMLGFLKLLEHKQKGSFLHIKIQETKRKKLLEVQKFNNKYQQIIVEKKIKAIEKKHEAAMNALSLVDFLETKAEESLKEKDMVLYFIKKNAEVAIEKNGLHVQAKHQLKFQALQHEEMLIKKLEQTITI